MVQCEVFGERLELYPQKAIFWSKKKILLFADPHLGKVNHFRKSGVPVPVKANDKNIEVLIDLIWKTKPERLICLGDLFHSHYNPEWEVFGELVKHFNSISFELVMGNHDIMSDLQYQRKNIVVRDELTIDSFVFTHHPHEKIADTHYNLAGHIHPSVHLSGKGKQHMKLPCFYFGKNQGLLPAFGAFTGLASVKPNKEDQVFVIADNKVHQVN